MSAAIDRIHTATSSAVAKGDVAKTIEALAVVVQGLGPSEKLRIPDFGTFSVVARPARTGRNPRTGESIEVPAKNVIKFKPQG